MEKSNRQRIAAVRFIVRVFYKFSDNIKWLYSYFRRNLIQRKFKRNVQTPFGDIRTVNYIPQCECKDILLWCQVKDISGYGFNLLLTKNDSSIYGDWYVLENKVSSLSRKKRNSPFGFTLYELPKEIGLINAMHIYDSKLYPYTQDMLLQYIADRV